MSSNRSPEPRSGNASGSAGPICLVVPTLARPGGAERVAVRLARAWSEQGRRVAIVSTDSPDQPLFFDIPEGVTVRHLDLMGDSRGLFEAVARNVRRVLIMRAAIRHLAPSVVISFIDVLNVTVVLASAGTSLPVIVCERTAPARAPIGRVWTTLRNLAYRMADHVVVQSEGAFRFFERSIGGRLSVIPNPVETPQAGSADRNGTRVVAMGRFTPEKGFDFLIRSFARAAADFPEWTLTIYGDGPLRMELEELIASEGMNSRILLPGVTADASQVFGAADIFVLSSQYEGFPNVLCEAMAAGTACISTDCPDGPREIIRDDIDGILVPPGNVASMTGVLTRLMGSRDERLRLGNNARSGIARFSPEHVLADWDRVIEKVCRTGASTRRDGDQ